MREGHYDLTSIKINDIELFCPNYSHLSLDEKEDFFTYLVAEMSKVESGNDTDNTLLENNGNISAELLQISYGSISKKYKENGFGIIPTLAKSTGYFSHNSKGTQAHIGHLKKK